jgi:hypothetical protein
MNANASLLNPERPYQDGSYLEQNPDWHVRQAYNNPRI